METKIMVITPDLAKKWLATNNQNRPIRMRRVEALARDMLSGNFVTTHQGIAFDEDGHLIDGQHRLTAIVFSGVSCKMTVTTGVPRECMFAVDNGAARDVRDFIAINNLFDGDVAFRQNSTVGVIRQLIHFGYNSGMNVTNAEILKVLSHYANEVKAIYEKSGSTTSMITAPIRAAALAAVINGENIDDIGLFFQVYAKGDTSGCFGCNTPAAFNLSRTVLKAKANKMSINKGKLYSMAQNAIYQFIRGDGVKVIKACKNDRYPVNEQIKKILEG